MWFFENRQSLLPVLLVLIATAFTTMQAQAAAISFGLAKGEEHSSEFLVAMPEYGTTCHATIFYNLLSGAGHQFDWPRDRFVHQGFDGETVKDGCVKQLVFTLLIKDKEVSTTGNSEASGDQEIKGNLDKILAGDYDRELTALAQEITKVGKAIVLRPLHEGNSTYNPWGMYALGNSPEAYARAFVHVISIFKRENAPVTIELDLNWADFPGARILADFDVWFPIVDPYVDMYTIAGYNRCGSTPAHTVNRSFEDIFGPAYDTLAAHTDKPINIAEVSTTNLCGLPKLEWWQDTFATLASDRFPQITMVTLFPKVIKPGEADNEVTIDWGIYGEDRHAFRQMVERARGLAPIEVSDAERE